MCDITMGPVVQIVLALIHRRIAMIMISVVMYMSVKDSIITVPGDRVPVLMLLIIHALIYAPIPAVQVVHV